MFGVKLRTGIPAKPTRLRRLTCDPTGSQTFSGLCLVTYNALDLMAFTAHCWPDGFAGISSLLALWTCSHPRSEAVLFTRHHRICLRRSMRVIRKRLEWSQAAATVFCYSSTSFILMKSKPSAWDGKGPCPRTGQVSRTISYLLHLPSTPWAWHAKP